MKPTRPKTPGKLQKSSSKDSIIRAPVSVYCRIRRVALTSQGPEPCLRVVSPTTVRLTPPSDSARGNGHAYQYSFKEVFTQEATQNEVFSKIAMPLVENLINGKNGLLFAYGVTGSGKTYSMTGEPQNAGIMPRCLDIIFNSIDNVQARRFVFRPDRANGFDIQGDADAAFQRQQVLHKTAVPKSARKNNSNPDLALSSSEVFKVNGVDEDNLYAVFVTYIEIYNNIVYDLLEEGSLGRRSPLTKIIREDSSHNMYVHGVTEVEVKTREEALEAFYKGLKRKRMAHTNLNSESSRSHSVFTIRLVQAPIDSMGETVVQDRKLVSVGQLSLVDLAGSERTSRTNNTGRRLREAGNINNSLMTLRACLEALRENQQVQQPIRVVPYRDAKITHLFKNFFDGEGHVRMVVCVNPSCEDFDETLQVMRFAEVAMEVEVTKPRNLPDLGAGMTPGRRKANMIFKQARAKVMVDEMGEGNQLDVDLALVYSLGGDFPTLELGGSRCEELIRQLTEHLEMRLQRRRALLRDKGIRDERFRAQLEELVKSTVLANTEASALRSQLEQERHRARALEQRLVTSEENVAQMGRKLAAAMQHGDLLKQQLDDKDMKLSQKVIEKEHQKRKFVHKMATDHDKMSKELDLKLKLQREKLKKAIQEKDAKIELVKQILTSDGNNTEAREERDNGSEAEKSSDSSQPPKVTSPNSKRNMNNIIVLHPEPFPSIDLTGEPSAIAITRDTKNTPTKTSTQLPKPLSKRHLGFAVSNPRHRRSLSADAGGSDRWLQHMPKPLVPSGTVMQPKFPKRKSVTKLINMKDITNPKTSNYCLISQEQDTDGELETKLYKGNVVPTSGGGAQVIFSDVEMLKITDPTASSGTKREGGDTPFKRIGNENKKPRV